MSVPHEVGTFLERQNRFVARVRLPDGSERSVHVASSGRMTDILIPGVPVISEILPSEPGRKTAGRLLMAMIGGVWVSVDTSLPGKLFRQAAAAGCLPAFEGYTGIRPEYPYGKSRIDFLLTGLGLPPCLVEVKSVTSVTRDRDGVRVARFPDAPTSRGTKHLHELTEALNRGYRTAVCFIVQREDVDAFGPYETVDPVFSDTLRSAARAGVEIYAWRTHVNPVGVTLDALLPLRLG